MIFSSFGGTIISVNVPARNLRSAFLFADKGRLISLASAYALRFSGGNWDMSRPLSFLETRRMDTKRCKECGQTKPLAEFYTSGVRRGKQQYRPKCISCTLAPRTKERLTLIERGMKKCTNCQSVLPIDDFYNDRRKIDGKRAVCKTCHVTITAEYQKTERGHEIFIAAKTRYNHKPETHKKRVVYMRQQRESGRWAVRESARHAVGQAVANGAIPSISSVRCADCGAQAKEYHHESYDQDKWLDVTPLCKDCHIRRHAQQ